MSIFDRFASRPAGAAGHLRVPGLAKSGSPFVLLCGDRGGQRRARVTRALIVLALLGLFYGSAAIMSEKPQPPPGAAPVWPPATAQGPFEHTLRPGHLCRHQSPSPTQPIAC